MAGNPGSHPLPPRPSPRRSGSAPGHLTRPKPQPVAQPAAGCCRGLSEGPIFGLIPEVSPFASVGELISYLAGTIFRTATAVSGAGPSSPEMRHVVIMGSPT
jgi:hypothetical protein